MPETPAHVEKSMSSLDGSDIIADTIGEGLTPSVVDVQTPSDVLTPSEGHVGFASDGEDVLTVGGADLTATPGVYVKTGNPPGRPLKFTPDTRNKILTALRGGNFRKVAAAYGGVTPQCLRNWLLVAERPGAPVEYVEFAADVAKAEADGEVANLALIRRSAQGHGDNKPQWQAAAWILERSRPERWGRKDSSHVEVTGADGGPIEVAGSTDTTAVQMLAATLAARAVEVAEHEDELIVDAILVDDME